MSPFAGETVRVDGVEHCARILAQRGYTRMVTAALTPTEQDGFLRAGFTVSQRLHLLRRGLDDVAPRSPALGRSSVGRGALRHLVRSEPTTRLVLRRGTRTDRSAILHLDRRCFDAFWTFDRHGLHEALSATPTRRMRVVDLGRPVAYAIFGKADDRGYLQRLAVDPAHRERGLGTALVEDGLSWLRRRGAVTVLVNTQEDNLRALRLYEGLGFRRCPEPLAVLERATGPGS